MTTSAVAGSTGRITVGGTKIAELKNFSFDPSVNMIDVTSTDSGGWEEVIPGRGSWSATATAWFVASDTIQTNCRAALTGKTSVAIELDPVVGSGKLKWTGTAYISNFKMNVGENAAISFDLTFKGSGAPTEGAQ